MATDAPALLTDEEVIRSFPCYRGPGTPAYYTDFLGTKTRASFISALPQEGGVVENYPIPMNFHATAAEWAGALRAALAATAEFVVLELGAGWGPWLVALAHAAGRLGVAKVHLVGVEASRAHCAYMATHFGDNGLDASQHTLLHGVVGVADGFAEFPVLTDPAGVWGAAAVYPDSTRPFLVRMARRGYRALRARARFLLKGAPCPPAMERVPCYSLATLLHRFETVDLVHVDIQGDEYRVLAAARDVLGRKVKRVVVGTHGRDIEQRLMEEMTGRGWALEGEEACQFRQNGTKLNLFRDGCQVWRNPALAGPVTGPRTVGLDAESRTACA
jgi:FkbM family methyltransferase